MPMASRSDTDWWATRGCSAAARHAASGCMTREILTMPDRVTRQPAADTAPRKENIETQRTVLLLNAQADRMRIELAQLRLSLAGAQRELSANRSAQL